MNFEVEVTLKEIEDTIRERMIKQGGPSLDRTPYGPESCRYRSPDGRACAVGCLILDEEYDPLMENEIVTTLHVSNGQWKGTGYRALLAQALNRSGVPGHPGVKFLLEKAQKHHDRWEPWLGEWEKYWREWRVTRRGATPPCW